MGADDGLKHFLMDIGAGERFKYGKRDYVISSRLVVSASWSTDGKTVILHNAFGGQEAFRVYKHTQ